MRDLTFRDVQREATAAGLVMSRRGVSICLRYRDTRISAQTWLVRHAADALAIVNSLRGTTCRADIAPG